MTRTLISAFSTRGYAITIRDFANGLQDYGVQLDENDVKKIFKYLDKTDSGKVDLADLLDELRG
jgi:Ca2+-binding EF-hand superfamily protein